ncbi:peptide deformylase [Motilimonas pumila]|uniref:Peptide deformylase n=1 Tax=Motilimonas pumila TaxID=2303987 RepID=A0A418YJ37_9GAMM|nr:peptide deformylase [Motilimonas pumila]RJG50663.1 peptide deformylase [Motilimonas pumila]
MALLEVLHFPDERLRTVAKPVAQVTPEIKQIVEDMFETMYQEEGIGLAATQVNIHQRIVVIDVSEDRNERLVLINPEIVETSGIEKMEEGCLSVPETRAEVQRADHIKVRALNIDGEEFEFETGDLLAVCIQHELDHLNGKLFIDYLSPLKRQRIKAKLEKAQRLARKS